MPYVTQQRIEAKIPAPHLVDALDDDRDGVADDGVLDEIIAAASNDVDALIASRYTVPFEAPFPAICVSAALAFAGEMIYARREIVEKNPFKKDADFWREKLKQIGEGEGSLDATTEQATTIAAVTEPVVLDVSLR